MARPEKFSADTILDGAAQAILAHGRTATMSQIAHSSGAPVGSVYYRFSSRDELLIRLWIRSVQHFQQGFIAASSEGPAPDAVVATALHIPRFCREHPADAMALTLYRHADLLHSAPPPLRAAVSTVNDDVRAAVKNLARRRYTAVDERRMSLLDAAIRQCPYGLVRPFIGTSVPQWVDDAVAASARAIAALGD